MTDDYRNVRGQDPYKGLKPEQIEKNKADKEGFKGPPERKGLEVFAKILQVCKTMVNTLTDFVEKQSTSSIERFIKRDLEEMKKAFNDLKKMDCSQDMQYISHLSDLWHQFEEDARHFKKDPLIHPLTQDWINQVKHYPEKEEHSLGFYLEEYAGHKWLPFPYMEMLRNLHLEHQRDPDNSQLTKWTDALTEITNSANALKKGKTSES